LRSKDLITLEGTTRGELREVLGLAHEIDAGLHDRSLAGKAVCLAFFEPSTRTSSSFELAAKRAGADVVSLSDASSISKGESVTDTAVTLDRLGVDALVIRHSSSGAAALATQYTTASVINAGDGAGQHPTQALLDLHTLSQALGGFDELEGRKAAVVGDVLHSRVARSVIPAFQAAGMELSLVAPPTLLPREADVWGLPILSSVDEAVEWGADVLYALRLQNERMDGEAPAVPSVSEYAAFYGIGRRHLRDGVLVMHPGPVNRGVEISGDVVLSQQSLVPDQVGAGMAVRAAVLTLATGARQEVAA
jgi:aspartate carbamoyltransferase catalytic subunit